MEVAIIRPVSISEDKIQEGNNKIKLLKTESNTKNELAKTVETKVPSIRYSRYSKIPIPKLHKSCNKENLDIKKQKISPPQISTQLIDDQQNKKKCLEKQKIVDENLQKKLLDKPNNNENFKEKFLDQIKNYEESQEKSLDKSKNDETIQEKLLNDKNSQEKFIETKKIVDEDHQEKLLNKSKIDETIQKNFSDKSKIKNLQKIPVTKKKINNSTLSEKKKTNNLSDEPDKREIHKFNTSTNKYKISKKLYKNNDKDTLENAEKNKIEKIKIQHEPEKINDKTEKSETVKSAPHLTIKNNEKEAVVLSLKNKHQKVKVQNVIWKVEYKKIEKTRIIIKKLCKPRYEIITPVKGLRNIKNTTKVIDLSYKKNEKKNVDDLEITKDTITKLPAKEKISKSHFVNDKNQPQTTLIEESEFLNVISSILKQAKFWAEDLNKNKNTTSSLKNKIYEIQKACNEYLIYCNTLQLQLLNYNKKTQRDQIITKKILEFKFSENVQNQISDIECELESNGEKLNAEAEILIKLDDVSNRQKNFLDEYEKFFDNISNPVEIFDPPRTREINYNYLEKHCNLAKKIIKDKKIVIEHLKKMINAMNDQKDLAHSLNAFLKSKMEEHKKKFTKK